MAKSKTEVKPETKKITVRPLMGYILVLPSEAESRTASGLYLPDSAKEKPAQGTVVALGTDIVLESGKLITAPVKIGDKVIFKKWGGDEIKVSGVEYKLVKFDDLMAILEG